MIKKARTEPILNQQLDALIRRLKPGHPAKNQIEADLAKSLAGYRGEQAVDYYLPQNDDYWILHDLRLQGNEEHFFQIDTFLVSEHFIILFEIKNIAGTLLFDSNYHQLIRTLDNKEEGFPDPITQVERQQRHFRDWMLKKRLPKVPIFSYVVISRPSSIIKSTHSSIKKILHAATIPTKIEQLEQQNSTCYFTKKDMRKLFNLLIKNHIPPTRDVLSYYQLQPDDLQTGIECPSCHSFKMVRERRNWECANCQNRSVNAHKKALKDYFLLIGSTMTNRECRRFLQLSSSSIASKLLRSFDFPISGAIKNRSYTILLDKVQE
ncbi:nuclease-related domain-containing protein [Jeotgalibacillus soli]|uniref:NERD domain-containing protein n=1 Tax=Jeotgalibacillus soli TaxID=889306 RepID=A0A0C2VXV6_9BACL|nr:nuclease-related domain-containing protein [Jeotgalibacillus soli]KIL49256.1 hypothetical protein KP78_07240 [Jeotgalibacillus soli]